MLFFRPRAARRLAAPPMCAKRGQPARPCAPPPPPRCPPRSSGGPDRRFTGIDLGSSSKTHSFCGSWLKEQRYPRGARRQWVRQEDQVQELQKLVFSGNANRIRSHYVKCTACPEDDPEFQQLVLFPIQAAEHWPLLTYQPGIARLCACDSGMGKLFAHSDEDCAPYSSLQLSWLLVWIRPRCPRTPFAWRLQCSRIVLTAVSMSSSMRARSLSPCSTATKALPSPT
jgi:hypothetical protein